MLQGPERSVCVVSVSSALNFSFENENKFLCRALSLSQGYGQELLYKKQSPDHIKPQGIYYGGQDR